MTFSPERLGDPAPHEPPQIKLPPAGRFSENLEPRLVRAAGEAEAISAQVMSHGRFIRELYCGRVPYIHRNEIDPGRIKRGDASFEAWKRSQQLLSGLADLPPSPKKALLEKDLALISDRAVSYNRETGVFLAKGPIDVVPAAHNRNFLRDGLERMYFLALHGLPTAYDFFCCTYTQTPRGYLQEAHLHRYSEELTLILSGSSECVWYEEDGANSLRTAGSVKAGPLQAFRIPPKVVHTLNSADEANENLTIKLSMFIDDRIGRGQWQFPAEKKALEDCSIDCGRSEAQPWGRTVRFAHGFEGLRFGYLLEELRPGCSMCTAGEELYLLVATGDVRLSCPSSPPRDAGVRDIIVISPGTQARIENVSNGNAVLFRPEGLNYRDFLFRPAAYPQYPLWLVNDLRWTVGIEDSPDGDPAKPARFNPE